MPKCILTEQGGKGGGSGVLLKEIKVTAQPSKKEYLAGDNFDPNGMTVTAYYGTDQVVLSQVNVTNLCTFTPRPLKDGDSTVTVTYTEGGVVQTTTLAVTVHHKVERIEVTEGPTKKDYEYNDTLNTDGIVVTAHYSDKSSSAVTTSVTYSPMTLTTLGESVPVTVSYTERQVTVKTTFNVTVLRK